MAIFVIMPFGSEFDHIYQKLIKPPFEEAGFDVFRADDIDHNQHSIMHDVVRGICTADLIVAELTTQNPNVLYELGLAHALKKPTVMIAQSIEDVPSDLRPYRFISYSFHYLEVEKLKKELLAIGNEIKGGTFVSKNPVIDFGSDLLNSASLPMNLLNGSAPPVLESEGGIWDFAVIGENAVQKIVSSIQVMAEMSLQLQERLGQRTNEINIAKADKTPGNASRIHKIIKFMSIELNQYSDGIENNLKAFHNAWEEVDKGVSGIFRVAEIKNQADEEAARTLVKGLEAVRIEISSLPLTALNVRESFSTWKNISRDLDHAAKKTNAVLQKLMDEFALAEALCERLVELIENKIKYYNILNLRSDD